MCHCVVRSYYQRDDYDNDTYDNGQSRQLFKGSCKIFMVEMDESFIHKPDKTL